MDHDFPSRVYLDAANGQAGSFHAAGGPLHIGLGKARGRSHPYSSLAAAIMASS
jgi:hypothetical protein